MDEPARDGPQGEPARGAWLFASAAGVATGSMCGVAFHLLPLYTPAAAHTYLAALAWLLLAGAGGWRIALAAGRRGWAPAGAAGGAMFMALAAALMPRLVSPAAGDILASAGDSWPLMLTAIIITLAPMGLAGGLLGGFSIACANVRGSASDRKRRSAAFWPAFGLMLGLALAHWVVVEHIGLARGAFVVAGLLWLVGTWGLARVRRLTAKPRLLIASAVAAALLIAASLDPPSDKALVSRAVSWPSARGLLAPSEQTKKPATKRKKKQKPFKPVLLFHAADRRGWIAATQAAPKLRRLIVDGAEVASTSREDQSLSQLLALLPAALTSGRGDALQLGLRDGGSLATLVSCGFRAVTCVEPRPQMRAAAQWLGVEKNVLPESAPVQFVQRQPRRFLRGKQGHYDAIVSAPRAAWTLGAGQQWSRSYFEHCRDALATKGVFATWLPLGHIDEAGLKAGLRTFAAAFEQPLVWVCANQIVLAGRKVREPLKLDSTAKRLDTPALHKRLGLRPQQAALELLGLLLMTEREIADYAGDEPLAARAGLAIERSAARSMLKPTLTHNLLFVSQYRNSLVQRLVFGRQLTAKPDLAKRLRGKFDALSILIARHADVKTEADDELFGDLLAAGKAGPFIENRPPPGPGSYKACGIACFEMGFYLGSYRLLKKALAEDYRDAQIRYYLGATCVRLGKKNDEAMHHLRRALRLNPKLAAAHLEMGRALLAMGKPETAIEAVEAGLKIDPKLKGAHTLIAKTYALGRQYDKAYTHCLMALEQDYRDKEAQRLLRLITLRPIGPRKPKKPQGATP